MFRKLRIRFNRFKQPIKDELKEVFKSKEDYLADWLITQTYHLGMAERKNEQSLYNHFSIIKNPKANIYTFRDATIKQFDQIMNTEYESLEILTEESPAKRKKYKIKTSPERHWLVTYSVGDEVKAKLFIHGNFTGWKSGSLIPNDLTSNYKNLNKSPDAVIFFPRYTSKRKMSAWYSAAEKVLVENKLADPVSNFLVESE